MLAINVNLLVVYHVCLTSQREILVTYLFAFNSGLKLKEQMLVRRFHSFRIRIIYIDILIIKFSIRPSRYFYSVESYDRFVYFVSFFFVTQYALRSRD